MKLRVRFGTTTKVVIIEDNVSTFVQLSEVRILIQNAFGGNLLNQPFKMGLNKTEPFKNEDSTIKECGIVDCDLIYIITENPVPVVESKRLKIQEKKEANNIKMMSTNSLEISSVSHGPFETMVDHCCISAYMKKMLFCHEATNDRVPEQLEMLLQSSLSASSTSHEIVIVALHQLLLEEGFLFASNVTFAESSHCEKVDSDLNEIFTNQRNKNFYRLYYFHPRYDGVNLVLVCIPMLRMLAIQGKLLNFPLPKENPPELVINSEDFVTQIRAGSGAIIYKNLKDLSSNFKDRVASRLLIEMKIALNIPDHSGFLGLFSEIQLKILKYLDLRSLLTVSLVCKDLYEKSRDHSLWKRMFMIYKKVTFEDDLSEDWFDNFKKLYRYAKIHFNKRKLPRHISLTNTRLF